MAIYMTTYPKRFIIIFEDTECQRLCFVACIMCMMYYFNILWTRIVKSSCTLCVQQNAAKVENKIFYQKISEIIRVILMKLCMFKVSSLTRMDFEIFGTKFFLQLWHPVSLNLIINRFEHIVVQSFRLEFVLEIIP